jgi:hypothetical protein
MGVIAEDGTTVSRDAQHATYAPAAEDKDAGYPPPGPGVEQTLGVPTESGTTSSTRSSKTSSSSSS